MTRWIIVGLFMIGAVGCGTDEPIGERWTAPISNGVIEYGYPEVGLLRGTYSGGQGSVCTATLIGATTVLTAGHCVESSGSYTITFGSTTLPIREIRIHPGYGDNVFGGKNNDVAVLKIASAPGIRPAAVARVAPSVGSEVFLVGFGNTFREAGDYGTKRSASNRLAWKTTDTLTYVATIGAYGNICDGDSGGPTFLNLQGNEAVVGIHSSSFAGSCNLGGNDMRVDTYLAWIQQAAGEALRVLPGDDDGTDVEDDPLAIEILSPNPDDTVKRRVEFTTRITGGRAPYQIEVRVGGVLMAQLDDETTFPISLPLGEATVAITVRDADDHEATAEILLLVTNAEEDTGDDTDDDENMAPDAGINDAQAETAAASGGCAMIRASASNGSWFWLLLWCALACHSVYRSRIGFPGRN